MKRILMSAFSCQPGKGSEPGVGWNWALQTAKCADVYVLTRSKMKPYIDAVQLPEEVANHLHFVYCPSSAKLRSVTIYLEYLHWQRVAYHFAKKLCSEIQFDYIWHITWGNMFLPTYMYKLPVPFIWGPVGGAEQVPKKFWNEFPKKNRLIHKCKYNMGKHMRWIPWVYGPAKRAEIVIARTTATKNLFPENLRDKILVHLESCVMEQKDFYFPENTEDILKKGTGMNLIYTGRVCDIKNLHALVPVMKQIHGKYPDIRVHIVGDGNMMPKFKGLVEKNGLDETFYFYGNVERAKLLKAVSQADGFVFPSLREGASWSLLEAMYFELPIVAFDANGMHDTLSQECAVMVPLQGKTPEEATAAFEIGVETLLSMTPQQRKNMGCLAHERLQKIHSSVGVMCFIRSLID